MVLKMEELSINKQMSTSFTRDFDLQNVIVFFLVQNLFKQAKSLHDGTQYGQVFMLFEFSRNIQQVRVSERQTCNRNLRKAYCLDNCQSIYSKTRQKHWGCNRIPSISTEEFIQIERTSWKKLYKLWKTDFIKQKGEERGGGLLQLLFHFEQHSVYFLWNQHLLPSTSG